MVFPAFSHYHILNKIGSGGMGEVYLAHDKILGRKVALKLLPADLTRDEDRLRRFRQEARAASVLNHPNILIIHEIGEADGHHFIATEFIEGETLRSRMQKAKMDVGAALDVGIQVTSALTAAHAKGIVHRDIKPENIMVRHDGYVKVLDFGLAKLTEPEASDPAKSTWVDTKPGLLLGTVQYMSPEQARGQPIDARTDIWSLGAVLYEAVAGRPAHRGASTGDVLVSVIEREPPPLTNLAPEVPVELERIVSNCLQKDRERRYQSAEEVHIDLKKLRREIESRPTAATVIIDDSADRQVRKPRQVLAALGVVVLLVFAFLAYELFSRRLGTPSQQEIASIAVLPLKNLSGDPAQDYFADGMTEALITDLARIGSLRVISRTTAMRYKNSDKSVPEIARELNVDGLVEGSVLRSGDNVRIQVQLVKAVPEERHLWTQEYNRNVRDVIALHGDVTRSIAREIRIKVAPGNEARLSRTVNPEAYDAYLKGSFYLNQATPEGTTKGLALLNEAVEKDPSNALPHAYLALGYATLGHGPSPPADAFDLARKAALRALELDEEVAEAHLVLAQLTMYNDKSWDWPAAERGLRRAMELNPALPATHAHYAWYVVLFDRWEEGFAAMSRAQQVDPLGPLWPAWQGSLYWWIGRNDEAIRECQKSLELNPNFPVALSVLGRAYSEKGMHQEAIHAQEKAVALNSSYRWSLGYAYARAGQRADALRTASEFSRTGVNQRAHAYELAIIYVALGDKEEALRTLETAFKERGELSPWVRNLHVFANLRNEPRFQDLLRRMNLPG